MSQYPKSVTVSSMLANGREGIVVGLRHGRHTSQTFISDAAQVAAPLGVDLVQQAIHRMRAAALEGAGFSHVKQGHGLTVTMMLKDGRAQHAWFDVLEVPHVMPNTPTPDPLDVAAHALENGVTYEKAESELTVPTVHTRALYNMAAQKMRSAWLEGHGE